VLLKDVTELSQVWMSHADTILDLPQGFEVLANTESIPYAAFRKEMARTGVRRSDGAATAGEKPLYCLQFHPEVYHSIEGKKIIRNFLVNICGCSQDWTPAHFVSDTVASLKSRSGPEGHHGAERRGGFHGSGDPDPSGYRGPAGGDLCRQWGAA
jgi:GMP synthase (glutamine-hydrolysing)